MKQRVEQSLDDKGRRGELVSVSDGYNVRCWWEDHQARCFWLTTYDNDAVKVTCDSILDLQFHQSAGLITRLKVRRSGPFGEQRVIRTREKTSRFGESKWGDECFGEV